MRALWLLALLALLVALLVAPAAAQTPTPPPAKSLTIALAGEPDRLYAPATLEGQLAANLVFDPLVGLTDTMQPYPVLAADIPSPDNGLVQLSGDGGDRRYIVTMPLKPGVTWSDGQPFTAADVVYTWQLMMNPESGFVTSIEDKLKSVDKVDDLTVRFTYLSANEARILDPDRYKNQGTNPVMDPLYMFGLYDAPAIYPQHILRQIVGDDPRHNPQISNLETSDFARNPVGTGPYVLSSWQPGSALTFGARSQPLPQRLAQPAIASVTLSVRPNKNDSLAALTADQVQVVAEDSLDPSDAPVLDTLPGVQARYTPGTAWEHLTFNFDNPALADPAVRQAFGYAINRPGLNDSALAGKGEVAFNQVPSWSWAFNPDLPHLDYGPAQANAVLDKAGWTKGADGIRAKNGKRVSFNYWSTPASFRPALMSAIKDQLAQVGIEMNIDTFPSATLFDTSSSASDKALVSRQFDVVEFAWVSSYEPGADAVYNMHSSSIPSKANGYAGGNYGDYKNNRSDQLLDQVSQSIDPNFRVIALKEAQTIWQSDLPVLPLVLRPITTATSSRLINFRPTPAPAGETWNIEQWDLAPPSAT
jgi:peptide/nickel transport system substrate-binding protein